MAENCCCCPANCGELRPGLLVLMPDAMGLPPGFIGLLALAIGFPRTCKQREWLSLRSVPEAAWRVSNKKIVKHCREGTLEKHRDGVNALGTV